MKKSALRRVVMVTVILLVGIYTILFPSKAPIPSKPMISKESTQSAQTQIVSESAIVRRVIDGDTIELADSRKVRYIGMNTPELHDPRRPVGCFGEEAYLENKRLVEGKTVSLVKDVSEVDKYGRLLRYVYVGTAFINETLVKEGFAQVATYPPDVKFVEVFQNAQREAQARGVGLWSACPVISPTVRLPK